MMSFVSERPGCILEASGQDACSTPPPGSSRRTWDHSFSDGQEAFFFSFLAMTGQAVGRGGVHGLDVDSNARIVKHEAPEIAD